MNRLLKSRATAWVALVVVVAVIIATFKMRTVWWCFIDEFFAFMMVFSQLIAVYTAKISPSASGKLHTCALTFGVLMILAIIGEFIAWQFVFG